MSFWTWMRQAALILVGRDVGGTNPRASSEYGALAIDSARRLHTSPVGTQGAPFLQDASNRLYAIPVGSANLPFLQYSDGELVVSKPGAIAIPSSLATVHVSTLANTIILSAPGTQVLCVEQIIMANNNALSNDVTLSRSTSGNASRLFRGTISAGSATVFEGPVYVAAGKPMCGSASIGPGLTVNVEGYRVK